jgi:imidazolonepropionase-like amidohydrolase
MRSFLLYFLLVLASLQSQSQTGFPVNGLADPRNGTVAFTNATIIKDNRTTLQNASMVVTGGKIVAIGTNITIPKEARVIDCQGKFIYPSFIDIYSDYGTPAPPPPVRFSFGAPPPPQAPQKGPFGWNKAIRADANAVSVFVVDDNKAKALRDAGFGTVLTHVKDGIVRGTGAVVTLADKKENEVTLKEKASAHYSFSKGSSTTTYPTSQMGSVALLRQTFLDAKWYSAANDKKDINLSLQAFNNNLQLPQIFETTDKWAAISADRIGDEFGIQYIIKGGGNEYQRIKEVAATKASFIVSLNYPQAMDVEDPNDARFVSLSNMQHWELAPTNPAAFEKAGIPFCLTAADLRDTKTFMANLRKAIEYGLSENKALEALTSTPASMIGIADKVGSLDVGKLANFFISSGPIFAEKTVILQNWVQGEKYAVREDAWSEIKGSYAVSVNGPSGTKTYTLDVKSASSASIIGANDTIAAKFSSDGKQVKLSFTPEKRSKNTIRLSGISNGTNWTGLGEDSAGTKLTWSASLAKAATTGADSVKKKNAPRLGKVSYPFLPYGNEEVPKAENLLIKNATVWTSDAAGKMENTDVLVKNGKIMQVGKGLNDASARIIDGTGKHLTPGIIDEHSHIAAFSINEGAESVTSEVRITDNLNPDDINIYRQLSGGVTTSHILHGSANTIGGQTQLIKLRWGVGDEELKFQGAPGFIKFALGENVKRSSSSSNTRFPDTRMGVEQVMVDAFTRAKEYEKQLKAAEENNKKKGATPMVVRRDLELDALVEILNNKRHITMHSYIQSEINAAMKVADKMGYKINTLTHILEGYKVADKMKLHGANASTFSDWWAYKVEVQDAIPYNAAIMHKTGLNVAINSDDAEMARRLNQEAAKAIKYGGISEEDALKMVTINPAKMLRVDDKTGSIKVGKDADLVLWSDHPLSVYAKAEKTIVDGTIYFDRNKDAEAQKKIIAERSRLIQKMLAEKREGGPMGPARPTPTVILHCEDHEHQRGLLEIEDFTTNND